MRRGALLAVMCGLFLCVGPAQAVTLVTPDGQVAQPYQYWANVSRAPTPAATLTVVDSQCPSAVTVAPASTYDGYPIACYSPGTRTIYSLAGSLDFVFFHELGHAFDSIEMTGAARAGYAKIVGAPWDAEMFADRYAYCAGSSPWPTFGERRAIARTDRLQQRRVCALVRRVGARATA